MTEPRLCTQCGSEGPFQKNSARKDGLDPYCSKCRNAKSAQWRQDNPEQVKQYTRSITKERRRKYNLKQVYGLSETEYDLMVEKQKGLCAICRNPPNKRGFHVDHDHETGKVRGLLCHHCNTALGLVKESAAVLCGMMSYLKSHQPIG